MKTHYLLFINLASLLLVCMLAPPKSITAQEYTLVKSADTNIQIDLETSFEASGLIQDANHLYFLDMNRDNQHIAVVDKTTLKQVDNIHLKTDGPSAINQAISIAFIDDNIGVFEFYSGKIKMVNSNGEVTKTIATGTEDYPYTENMTLFINPILSLSNHIIIPQIGGLNNAARAINYKSPVLKKLHVESNSYSYLLNYPESYQKPLMSGMQSFFSLTQNQNEVVVSFPLDHDLYVIVGDQVKKVKVDGAPFKDFEGHYFDSFDEFKNPDYREAKAKYWASYSYGLLTFDPFENVYYREVKLPIKNARSLPNDAQESEFREYIILIYDTDFNYLGKSDTIEGVNLTLNGGNYFITERGLHLFKADQNNEDLMQFSSFQLKKN